MFPDKEDTSCLHDTGCRRVDQVTKRSSTQVWESSANDLSHPLNHHKAWPRRHLPKPLCSSKFTEHSHVLSSTHNSKAVLVLVTSSSDAGGLWNQRDTRMRLVIMSSCFGQGYTSAASFVQWSTGLLWGRAQPLRNHMSLIRRHRNSSSSFINYILLEINPGLFLRGFFSQTSFCIDNEQKTICIISSIALPQWSVQELKLY